MAFLKNLKEKMGIPDDIQPLIAKMTEFTQAVQKLTAGLADGIDAKDFEALKEMLGKYDSINVSIPDGPAKATLQNLRNQAVSMLSNIKGAEPLLAMLKLQEKKEEGGAAPTAAAPVATPAPVAAVTPAAPATVETPATTETA